jgi:hypothetical protein
MARNKRPLAELREASRHLHYEITMFHAAAEGLRCGLFGNGPITNVLLESFAVHVRNLIDFLYSEQPRADDVVAEDFVAETLQWPQIRPTMSDVLLRAKRRADKEIAHLTYTRLAVTSDAKPWPFVQIFGEITSVFKLYMENVDRERLDKVWA